MAYQRFAFAKSNIPPATVAILSTVPAEPPQSVAKVANVAGALGDSSISPAPERVAIHEADAAVPAVYVKALAALMATCPAEESEARWRQAIDDAGRFLDAWGEQAAMLGWTSADRLERSERGAHGLAWELAGREVVELTATTAVLGPDDRTERAWFARPGGGDAATV